MRVSVPLILILALAADTATLGSEPAEKTWPQFRGHAGRGVSPIDKLPTRWSATENVKWKASVPGRGWSSPIVWGDQVIVTSAVSPGAFKPPSKGIFGNDYAEELQRQGLPEEEIVKRVKARDIESTEEAGELHYMVYSFDVGSGKLRWQHQAHKGAPFGGRHRKNTYASETPATDGERIYALFGNVGLFCYSMDGKLLWTHRIDPQPRYLDFGTAASPVVHNGRVYLLDDNEVSSYVINPGDRYDEVAKNSLGEMSLATPAVTTDGLFVRTVSSLYRIR